MYRGQVVGDRGTVMSNAVCLGPRERKQLSSALRTGGGKPTFIDRFSSFGTINSRLESKYVECCKAAFP